MHNELYHYGIKDQKWGVRRYQNEDGTLTPLGKERYSKSERKELNARLRSEKRKRRNINKYRMLMDESELNKHAKRLETEDKVNNLTTKNDSVISGKNYLKNASSNIGKTAVAAVATPALIYAGTKFTGKVMNDPEAAKAIWKKYITPKK